jgi:hypothetical protein
LRLSSLTKRQSVCFKPASCIRRRISAVAAVYSAQRAETRGARDRGVGEEAAPTLQDRHSEASLISSGVFTPSFRA